MMARSPSSTADETVRRDVTLLNGARPAPIVLTTSRRELRNSATNTDANEVGSFASTTSRSRAEPGPRAAPTAR